MAGSCRRLSWSLLLPCLCCLLAPVASSSVAVTHLPGFDGPLPFSLETGYVEVDESNGVNLFYYFVESEKDPVRDPLVVWMQGGPGCSGLSGLVYEIGPFQIDAEGYRGGLPTLLYRPETWTKVSNIIFIDAPVGAGFSYATSEEGLKSSDTMAVKTLVVFLKKYEPGELVDRNNKESYMRYMLQKLQNGELTIFTPRAFKCPFDDKPDDGQRAALLTHARSLSRVGKTEQIQASHKALLLYMVGDADPDLPGINSARHQRRKMARKVKKDRKLDLEYGGKQQ